eukprot:TRINITY_DN22978_c0_g1_i1.p1 TRINITY_DN22978_c0_g1~~TRINITY_DN22978_c0_g1_i1.p1  ORF type:complete len:326 (-),score=13.00 TRINITY_DN22978_c0_g1_i1:930-1829(-)
MHIPGALHTLDANGSAVNVNTSGSGGGGGGISKNPGDNAGSGTEKGYDASFNNNFEFADFCKGTEYCRTGSDGTVTLTAAKGKMGSFQSQSYFQYGAFSVKIKLPPGYSGGLIPCIYLMSGENLSYRDPHDEMDFEFLGWNKPTGIKIHTNLIATNWTYVEQYKFAFDPSADYHKYTMVYSKDYAMWLIDDSPIRITYREPGKPFPKLPMKVMGSIWDASYWLPFNADYSKGNVTVKFRRFDLKDACRAPSPSERPACAYRNNPYKAPWMAKPGKKQRMKAEKYRSQYLYKAGSWVPVV